MTLVLDLKSTNVGRPSLLGLRQGERVISGIRKSPIGESSVAVSRTNIAGDEQSDLSVHGGIDRAVYAYSADHWPWWKSEAGFEAAPASFGENLTVAGADEGEIHIGDKFLWGDVPLEVSVPRGPCFKLVMLTGREDVATRMTLSARTGWYFRVLEEGVAPTRGALVRIASDERMPSVAETFAALYHPRVGIEVMDKAIAAPALPEGWREAIADKRNRRSQSGKSHD